MTYYGIHAVLAFTVHGSWNHSVPRIHELHPLISKIPHARRSLAPSPVSTPAKAMVQLFEVLYPRPFRVEKTRAGYESGWESIWNSGIEGSVHLSASLPRGIKLCGVLLTLVIQIE